jgi:hypothetical protein
VGLPNKEGEVSLISNKWPSLDRSEERKHKTDTPKEKIVLDRLWNKRQMNLPLKYLPKRRREKDLHDSHTLGTGTRIPHHTCGCEVNSPHNRTCTARGWTCGVDFFFLRIDVSKIEVSDKKHGFNEERVLSVSLVLQIKYKQKCEDKIWKLWWR